MSWVSPSSEVPERFDKLNRISFGEFFCKE